MANLPDSVADTALSRLFAGDHALPDAKLIHLPGGEHLFDAEDASQPAGSFFTRFTLLAVGPTGGPWSI